MAGWRCLPVHALERSPHHPCARTGRRTATSSPFDWQRGKRPRNRELWHGIREGKGTRRIGEIVSMDGFHLGNARYLPAERHGLTLSPKGSEPPALLVAGIAREQTGSFDVRQRDLIRYAEKRFLPGAPAFNFASAHQFQCSSEARGFRHRHFDQMPLDGAPGDTCSGPQSREPKEPFGRNGQSDVVEPWSVNQGAKGERRKASAISGAGSARRVGFLKVWQLLVYRPEQLSDQAGTSGPPMRRWRWMVSIQPADSHSMTRETEDPGIRPEPVRSTRTTIVGIVC